MYQAAAALPFAVFGGLPGMLAGGGGAAVSQTSAELGAPQGLQILLDLITGHKITRATAAGSLGDIHIPSSTKPHFDINLSQGNNPGNNLNVNQSQSSNSSGGGITKTPLQNIKGTIYSKTNLNKPFHGATVKEIDAAGAHIEEKHINVDDTYILARANPPDGHYSPDNASRFFGGSPAEEAIYGKDFAQHIIQDALRKNEDMIVRNMLKGRDRIEVTYSPNMGPIGRGVPAGTLNLEDMHDIKIIIVKDKINGLYRITTAYPFNQ